MLDSTAMTTSMTYETQEQEKTHPMRPQDAAIPVRQQNVGAVDEPKTDGHFRVPLLHLLQLLEEPEVAGDDDGLSGGRYLHGLLGSVAVKNGRANGAGSRLTCPLAS